MFFFTGKLPDRSLDVCITYLILQQAMSWDNYANLSSLMNVLQTKMPFWAYLIQTGWFIGVTKCLYWEFVLYCNVPGKIQYLSIYLSIFWYCLRPHEHFWQALRVRVMKKSKRWMNCRWEVNSRSKEARIEVRIVFSTVVIGKYR